MTIAGETRRPRLFEGLVQWWRNLRAARMRVDELANCGGEVSNIAHDVGLSTSELYAIAAKRADAADQLKQRLEALHLDRAALLRSDPLVMRDLERTCTLCGAKRRCERDLARNPDDPAWQDYCPNVHTLEALEEGERRLH